MKQKQLDKEIKKEEIKQELKPIHPYLTIITDENGNIKYNGIGLSKNISFKDLKKYGVIPKDTTKKQFIKLLDWFNENRKTFNYALKEIHNNQ